MTGSMYAAIAGLKTHMQNLNVIGNNVANVNTQSYKAARSVFKTAIYTTMSGGSNGTQTIGGKNPSQIGYGANMGSVDIDMSTGNYSVTGNATDMMLDGDGFFLMGNKDVANNFDGSDADVSKLTSLTLTRLGNFGFKADGYLTNNDLCVYGFMCIGVYGDADHQVIPAGKKAGDPIFSDQLVPIRYPGERTVTKYYNADGEEVPPNDDGTQPADTTAKEVVEIAYAFEDPTAGGRVADAYEQVPVLGEDGQPVDPPQFENVPYTKAQFTGITVDQKTGLITGRSNATKELVTIGCVAVGQVTNPNGVTQIGSSYYTAGNGSGDLTVSILGGGAEDLGLTHVNASLRQAGVQDPNDPDAAPAAPADGLRLRNGGDTGLLSNGLEMSKTDLAQEIANMIVTQRGYQANTRIITVTDSMLEELVNMKR